MSLGIDYNRQHQIDYSLIVLNDTRDQFREKVGNSANIQLVDDQRIREYEVLYEERPYVHKPVERHAHFPKPWLYGCRLEILAGSFIA